MGRHAAFKKRERGKKPIRSSFRTTKAIELAGGGAEDITQCVKTEAY